MAIEVIQIDDTQAQLILDLEEGHFVDLKRIEIAPAKLTKAMSAFANADGGKLFLGIDENETKTTRTWRGFANVEAANGHLQAFEAIFPLGQD